jgi:hypothetical protein
MRVLATIQSNFSRKQALRGRLPLMAIAAARPIMVSMASVCTYEVRSAVGRDPMPRQLREGRSRGMEDGRDALRQERDGLRAKVEDLVS